MTVNATGPDDLFDSASSLFSFDDASGSVSSRILADTVDRLNAKIAGGSSGR